MTPFKPMLRVAAMFSLCFTSCTFATDAGLPSRISENLHYEAFDYKVFKEDPGIDADAGLLYAALWADALAYCDARGGYLASYDNHRRGVAYLGVGNLKETAFATCGIYPGQAASAPPAPPARLRGLGHLPTEGDTLALMALGDRDGAYKLTRDAAYAFCRGQDRRIANATFSYSPRASGGYNIEAFVRCDPRRLSASKNS